MEDNANIYNVAVQRPILQSACELVTVKIEYKKLESSISSNLFWFCRFCQIYDNILTQVMKSLISMPDGAMSKSADCALLSYIKQLSLDQYATEILKCSKSPSW